jgi:SAM-dependent methyltransferase
MPPADATRRFSSRVDNYVRFRPGYPLDIIKLLERECGLQPKQVIADIGSGTGILSQMFLDRLYTVICVEPNAEMRAAGEMMLKRYSRFYSVAGTAEATTLKPHSLNLIMAGQAYHWFDSAAAAKEFRRVLIPGGWVVLIWNNRQTDTTAFLQDYEALLHEFCDDYQAVDHKSSDPAMPGVAFKRFEFPNAQFFDYEGVQGRLLSSSYAPEPGHIKHNAMLARLREIFDAHQEDGQVGFLYTTRVYIGQMP